MASTWCPAFSSVTAMLLVVSFTGAIYPRLPALLLTRRLMATHATAPSAVTMATYHKQEEHPKGY